MANTNWENLPSENTPINATNLNKISDGLVNVSNSLDSTYKTNIIHSKNMFEYTDIVDTSNVSSYSDGVITLTWSDAFNIDIYKILTSLDSSKSYTISFKHKGNSLKLRNNAVGSSNILTTGVNSDYTLCSVVLTGISAFQFRFLRDDTTGTAYIKELQIEEGSTATTYEAFIPNSIIVNGEKYSDTINVGQLDSRSRVNFIKGKNLVNVNTSVNFYIATNSTSETLEANAYAITSAWITCKPNTNYTISGSDVNRNRWQVKNASGTITYKEGDTITTNADSIYLRCYYYYGTSATTPSSKTNIMLNEGSSAQDYEPFTYNEIIVNNEKYTDTLNVGTGLDGRSKVNFVKSLNLFNSNIINGNVSDSQIQSSTTRICTKTFIKVKPSTQYTLSFSGSLQNINISYFTHDSFPRESESGWTSTFTFTTKANTNYIMISWRKSSNNENINPADISNIMLSEGNTAFTYQPYGTSINVENEEIYNQSLFNNDVFKSQNYIQQDFNLYTTPGSYMINNTSLSNRPNNIPGVLLVFVGKYSQLGVCYISQIFISNTDIYTRFRDTGSTSWGTWKQINN